MPVIEILALVAACVSAFRDGQDLWATYKKKRRDLRSGRSANLETALVEAPKQVTNHYYTCSSQGGHDFVRGDEIANMSLSQSLDKFGRTVLETMKSAVTQNNSLNLQSMAAMTHMFKKESMSTMDELYQRVRQAAPVPRAFKPPDGLPLIPPLVTSNSAATLLAAFNTLALAHKPSEYSVEGDIIGESIVLKPIIDLDIAVQNSKLRSASLVQRHLEVLGLLPWQTDGFS
ncbi:uncharacterized protein PAC_03119 [Phialocephala subalpina]|uniref:Uncharacterized protein n=1 Tax=Phialocephala subalpina TaxID=576137 RepID=A0A1L7WKE2_9HELO|nr:uncharacterized protein PAC_03119 [Phialocephala subalpina]